MAFTFPTNPSNGDTHTQGGNTYTYNSTLDQWVGNTSINTTTIVPDSVLADNVPGNGQILSYDSDSDSFEWIDAGGGGGSGGSFIGSMVVRAQPRGNFTITLPESAVGYSLLAIRFNAPYSNSGPVLNSWGFRTSDAAGDIPAANILYNSTGDNSNANFNVSNTVTMQSVTTAGDTAIVKSASSSAIGSATTLSAGGNLNQAIFFINQTIASDSSFRLNNYSTGSTSQLSYVGIDVYGIS